MFYIGYTTCTYPAKWHKVISAGVNTKSQITDIILRHIRSIDDAEDALKLLELKIFVSSKFVRCNKSLRGDWVSQWQLLKNASDDKIRLGIARKLNEFGYFHNDEWSSADREAVERMEMSGA